MKGLALLALPYSIYALLFGVYVSIRIACGYPDGRKRHLGILFGLLLLGLQGVIMQLHSSDTVRLLYPVITHLPLIVFLALGMKAGWFSSLVSVLISYAMCQLLRWTGLLAELTPLSPLWRTILHLCACHALLIALDRWCLDAVHRVISQRKLAMWLGVLPGVYYAYEYVMIYTGDRYARILALNELLPTAMVLFFLLFVIAYHHEMEKRRQAQRQTVEMERRLSEAGHEIALLRALEEQTAVYRHDLRHHLTMIRGLLLSNQQDQAASYLSHAEAELDGITPRRFCENETINLLLRTFERRSEKKDVRLEVKTILPPSLPVPDPELCALLSNGLENALNAAAETRDGFISVFCQIRQNNLLFEIRNPYAGAVEMHDGLPVSRDGRPHYGCRSIQTIVHAHSGVCTFEAKDGIFTLRIAIPMQNPKTQPGT